jgi:hypothetical protein
MRILCAHAVAAASTTRVRQISSSWGVPATTRVLAIWAGLGTPVNSSILFSSAQRGPQLHAKTTPRQLRLAGRFAAGRQGVRVPFAWLLSLPGSLDRALKIGKGRHRVVVALLRVAEVLGGVPALGHIGHVPLSLGGGRE